MNRLSLFSRLGPQLRMSMSMSSSAPKQESGKVGFIGLGQMGSRMAANLISAGHQLVVYDSSIGAMERLCEAHDAEIASSPEDVASTEGVDVVVTMLRTVDDVRRVYLGSSGILAPSEGVGPSLLIDCSTIDPPSARQVAAAVQSVRLHKSSRPFPECSVAHPSMVDAPVSGGITGAAAGTLTFMCGGDKAAVRAAEPFLLAMGREVVHCGDSGAGAAAKVCNNLVLGVSMAAVAEGLSLGQRLGIDAKTLSRIFNTSSARCWSSDVYNPCPGVINGTPASKEYKEGFAASLMVKDLALAQASAEFAGVQAPMTERAKELYERIDDGGLDFGSIFQHVYKGRPEL